MIRLPVIKSAIATPAKISSETELSAQGCECVWRRWRNINRKYRKVTLICRIAIPLHINLPLLWKENVITRANNLFWDQMLIWSSRCANEYVLMITENGLPCHLYEPGSLYFTVEHRMDATRSYRANKRWVGPRLWYHWWQEHWCSCQDHPPRRHRRPGKSPVSL